jgi:hypothetical protein
MVRKRTECVMKSNLQNRRVGSYIFLKSIKSSPNTATANVINLQITSSWAKNKVKI